MTRPRRPRRPGQVRCGSDSRKGRGRGCLALEEPTFQGGTSRIAARAGRRDHAVAGTNEEQRVARHRPADCARRRGDPGLAQARRQLAVGHCVPVGNGAHGLPDAELKLAAHRRERHAGGGGDPPGEIVVQPGRGRSQCGRVLVSSKARVAPATVEGGHRLRGSGHGLVDAVGGAEETLPGPPQADERTAPRGQREAADGGVVGGECRVRTARGALGRHTPTLSRRQSQRESRHHGRRSVRHPRSPPRGDGDRPPQWAR